MAEIDRKKIIKGLECCSEHIEDASCSDCPYVDDCDIGECTSELAHDTLSLLKEQETSNTGKDRLFQCEKCGYGFDDIFLTDEHNYDTEPNYCPNCGRSVK